MKKTTKIAFISSAVENVSTEKGLDQFIGRSVKAHEAAKSAILERPIVTDMDERRALEDWTRENSHQREELRIGGLTGESKLKALELIKRASRTLAVYDKAKVGTLAARLNDPAAKLNNGISKALQALKRVDAVSKEVVTVTDINRTYPHRNDVRSSLTLLVKLGVLSRTGQANHTEYRVEDAPVLTAFFNAIS